MFAALSVVDPAADESVLVERIAALERLKSAAAAAQAQRRPLGVGQTARRAAAGVPAASAGMGLAAEVALARRDSPARGGRHLGFAKALVHEMPHTLAALEAGRCRNGGPPSWCGSRPAWTSRTAAGSTPNCVRTGSARRVGDAAWRPRPRRSPTGWIRMRWWTGRPRPARTHGHHPARARHMTYLTALLPVAQGVSVYAALKREADVCFDGRSRGQVMADTLVERVTGRPADQPVPVAVNLVISDQALLGAEHARRRRAATGRCPRRWRRRWSATPSPTAVRGDAAPAVRHPGQRRAGGDGVARRGSSRRVWPQFIGLRDQRCRTPYCDAPIRHRDHANPHRRGRPDQRRQRGRECEACNYTKEAPGWAVATQPGKRQAHSRIHHPDRNNASLDRSAGRGMGPP